VFTGQVKQEDPLEEHVTQVDKHVMQEELVLPAGFTELPEHRRQVPALR
jgi:hypothetical protein